MAGTGYETQNLQAQSLMLQAQQQAAYQAYLNAKLRMEGEQTALNAAQQAASLVQQGDMNALQAAGLLNEADFNRINQAMSAAQTLGNWELASQGQRQNALQSIANMGLSAQGQRVSTLNAAEQAQQSRMNTALNAAQTAGNQGLQALQLQSSLRGPRNAFQQQAAMSGLNAQGLSRAVDAIAGRYSMPSFGGQQAPAEGATLGTMAQDQASAGGQSQGGTPYDTLMGLQNWQNDPYASSYMREYNTDPTQQAQGAMWGEYNTDPTQQASGMMGDLYNYRTQQGSPGDAYANWMTGNWMAGTDPSRGYIDKLGSYTSGGVTRGASAWPSSSGSSSGPYSQGSQTVYGSGSGSGESGYVPGQRVQQQSMGYASGGGGQGMLSGGFYNPGGQPLNLYNQAMADRMAYDKQFAAQMAPTGTPAQYGKPNPGGATGGYGASGTSGGLAQPQAPMSPFEGQQGQGQGQPTWSNAFSGMGQQMPGAPQQQRQASPYGSTSASQYSQALPALNKINLRAWNQMSPDSKEFMTGAYETAGYSANDLGNTLSKMAPTWKAPTFGGALR